MLETMTMDLRWHELMMFGITPLSILGAMFGGEIGDRGGSTR